MKLLSGQCISFTWFYCAADFSGVLLFVLDAVSGLCCFVRVVVDGALFTWWGVWCFHLSLQCGGKNLVGPDGQGKSQTWALLMKYMACLLMWHHGAVYGDSGARDLSFGPISSVRTVHVIS